MGTIYALRQSCHILYAKRTEFGKVIAFDDLIYFRDGPIMNSSRGLRFHTHGEGSIPFELCGKNTILFRLEVPNLEH